MKLFDKLSYKQSIYQKSRWITEWFGVNLPFERRNEGILFCTDILPSGGALYTTEVNTNTALDDDIVDWFDFKKLCEVISNWEYHNIIVLVEENQKDIIHSAWYKELEKQVSKINRPNYTPKVKLQIAKDINNIWDFKFHKQEDFILRIAWNKDCLLDKMAADKRAWNRFEESQRIYDKNPKYYGDGESDSIYEKNEWFVFKKRHIDKKNGVGIFKFKNKKDFEDTLKEYDFVEKFIEMDVDEETGFHVEIKEYLMIFKKTNYHLTPNVYTQLWDYSVNGNKKSIARVSKGNVLAHDLVELEGGGVVEVSALNENSTLKHGGRVLKVLGGQGNIHKRYIRLNNEIDLCYSSAVINDEEKFKSTWTLKVGDKIRIHDDLVEINNVEVIEKNIRTKYIETEMGSIRVNGIHINSKTDNFVLGPEKEIIYNPNDADSVLSFDENGILNGIMDKVQDKKMPDRVVEITFETNGTYFTSEFLFEKPLKVINSQDYDIRMDRTDGNEPFGTHKKSGAENKRPTFGWASYKPELTKQIKDMEVMKLRPGMMCLTPKRKDMVPTEELYGDMIPCKVVSMREMVGKRSHWDIYTIVPTENYFMNRMHVHNGPSAYPLINAPNIISHWDAGNPQSLSESSPFNTWYDLSGRADMDLAKTPAISPAPLVTLTSIPQVPGPQYPGFNGMLIPESVVMMSEKQPSNPYHTSTIFNSQTLFTSIMAVSVINANPVPGGTGFNPSSPSINRMIDIGPGNNHTMGVNPQGYLITYTGPSTQTAPSDTDMIPGGTFHSSGRSQIAKMRCVWQKTDQSSPYMSYGFDRKPSQSQDFSYVKNQPTPSTNPRTPASDFGLGGGVAPPHPGTGGNFCISHCVLYDAQLTKAEIAEQWDEWRAHGSNSDLLYND